MNKSFVIRRYNPVSMAIVHKMFHIVLNEDSSSVNISKQLMKTKIHRSRIFYLDRFRADRLQIGLE